jgi:exodeoxyribonuclease-3
MAFSVATWNINSVRLRLPIVEDFLTRWQPDVLCLQEIKCQNDQFPMQAFAALGYEHASVHGQKGYHGVATLSKRPLLAQASRFWCGIEDCRHTSVDVVAGGKRVIIHNFYVPAGGDEADPQTNDKFAHKLKFIDEMKSLTAAHDSTSASILVGDLNIAPLEHDVWSHKQMLKVVSHTPVETEGLTEVLRLGGWTDLMRQHVRSSEKLYTWWSYRARDWDAADRGRRLDHIWSSPNIAPQLDRVDVLREARSWEKPSDHVPVIAHFDLD